MGNKAIFTALIGDYDDLLDPEVITPGWDYIVFTDQDIHSAIWQVRKVDANGDPQRMARRIKVKWHEYIDNDISFWLDCSFHIRCDLDKFISDKYVEPFSVPRHPIRECVYREIDSCIVNQRGNEAQLIAQRDEYKRLGVPPFNGIITSGVMLRKLCPFTIDFCNDWWAEMERHSVRDQVAFAKVAWEWRWQYHNYKWDYSQSKELKYLKHKKYRQ